MEMVFISVSKLRETLFAGAISVFENTKALR